MTVRTPGRRQKRQGNVEEATSRTKSWTECAASGTHDHDRLTREDTDDQLASEVSYIEWRSHIDSSTFAT